MADFKEKPNTIPWPPIITIGAIIIGWIAQRFEPLDWIADISQLLWPLGVLMVVVALSIDVWTYLTFKQMNTTILPTKAASNLAMSGPFRWSRNPIYLGNIMLISGIALASGNAWMLITAAVAIFAIEEFAIKREEKHLLAKFGSEWTNYTTRVRRWI